MRQLIECVPNFSEGRDMAVIGLIEAAIRSVPGANLLHIDSNPDAHRTVFTFAGEPEAVCEAAFRAMKAASEHIDMGQQTGVHPRFGSTDVCPLVPLKNITLEETALLARCLAQRVGEELDYPVYCYEASAFFPKRKNLAYVRAGGYEALPEKLLQPIHKPDYGPAAFRSKAGATAIGARGFLIAFNFNLDTQSVELAKEIALDVRAIGREMKDNEGNILKDENGKTLRIPGSCPGSKAIGWYMEGYGCAQVSMNINDVDLCPMHKAYEEVCKQAKKRGVKVRGSELIGLTPLRLMESAGRYFLEKQGKPHLNADLDELMRAAVAGMGLDALKAFDYKTRVLDLLLGESL